MGKIPDGSFKDWQDTQVVNALDYKQEREMLRVAVNDNDANILVNAQGIVDLNVAVTSVADRTSVLEADSDSTLRADISTLQSTTYTKTETDNKLTTKVSGVAGLRIEFCDILFFTNGGSTSSTSSATFAQAFTTPPTIAPSNIITVVPYGDNLIYPYPYNITTTGFSVKIATKDGNLGTVGTPANLAMRFLVIGK
jgi:hypothetical protein